MSQKVNKTLRKEVKESVKELLPSQLTKSHEDLVMASVNKRLDLLEKMVRAQINEALKKLEEDHKSTMDYLIRNLTTGKLDIK